MGPGAGTSSEAPLLCDILACDSVFFREVLGVPEHQDGVVDLQRGAQLDLHHSDDVRLCQKQEGFAIYLLQTNKQTKIKISCLPLKLGYLLGTPGC